MVDQAAATSADRVRMTSEASASGRVMAAPLAMIAPALKPG